MIHNSEKLVPPRAQLKLRISCISACWWAMVMLAGAGALAAPPVHFNHAGVLAPGAIGAAQLQRGGPLSGYFQPVEIRVPEGSAISLAADGHFTQPQPGGAKAGML